MLHWNRCTPGLLAGALALLLVTAGCDEEESPDATPPPIPTGVYSVTGDFYVDVYWSPIRGLDDLAGYGVYRSSAEPGPYHKLAVVDPTPDPSYRDDTAVNGVTYYYAVDAFDENGNESQLSVESVFDTPRPAGVNLRLYAADASQARSGLDFSAQPSESQMVVPGDDPLADLRLYHDGDGVMRVVGTQIEGAWNELQDVGWTQTLDEVSYAPPDGWSARSPLGLEVIGGHSYVVWTWDNYFAKFRVTSVTATYAVLDWAYQVAQGNPELARPVLTAKGR